MGIDDAESRSSRRRRRRWRSSDRPPRMRSPGCSSRAASPSAAACTRASRAPRCGCGPATTVLTGHRLITIPVLDGPRSPACRRTTTASCRSTSTPASGAWRTSTRPATAPTSPSSRAAWAASRPMPPPTTSPWPPARPVDAEPFRPVLRGKLLTGREAAFLRVHLSGGGGEGTASTDTELWWPPAKLSGRWLSPRLAWIDAGRPQVVGRPSPRTRHRRASRPGRRTPRRSTSTSSCRRSPPTSAAARSSRSTPTPRRGRTDAGSRAGLRGVAHRRGARGDVRTACGAIPDGAVAGSCQGGDHVRDGPGDGAPAIETDGLTKRYGATAGSRTCRFAVAAGRGLRLPRAQRRRQDDDDPDAARPDPPDRGHGAPLRPRQPPRQRRDPRPARQPARRLRLRPARRPAARRCGCCAAAARHRRARLAPRSWPSASAPTSTARWASSRAATGRRSA